MDAGAPANQLSRRGKHRTEAERDQIMDQNGTFEKQENRG